MPDVDCEPDVSDPEIEPVNQVEVEVNSDAEYAKIKLPCQGTLQQRSMNLKVAERIKHVY